MNQLWQQLAADGLVTGDAPPPDPPSAAWYVNALLGTAAWIAAVLLTVVIGILTNSQSAMGLMGALALAAGLALLRFPGPFLTQLGLASAIAGQAGLAFGLEKFLHGDRFTASLTLIFLLPSFLTTHAIFRVWCVAGALICAAFALHEAEPLVIAAAAALVCAIFLVMPQLPRAYGYGAALGLLIVEALAHFDLTHLSPPAHYAGGLASGALLVYAVHRLFGTLRAAACAALVALLLIPAGGVASALLVILIGFGRAAPALTGLGIAAGLGYLGHYYYLLSLTLLQKSLVLMATGLVLLTLRFLLFRKVPA